MMRGSIYRKKGDYKESLSIYEDAARMYKKIFSDRHPEYVYALSKTAQLNYILNKVDNANEILGVTTTKYLTFIQKYFPALSEREKSKFWNKIKEDFEFYNTVAFKNKKAKPDMIAQVYDNVLIDKSLITKLIY